MSTEEKNESKKRNEYVVRNVIIAYPCLAEQKKSKETGELQGYTVTALMDKNTEEGREAEREFRKIIKAELVKAKGEDKKNWPKPYSLLNFKLATDFDKSNQFPLRDGDATVEEGKESPLEGKVFINLKNKKERPICAVVRNGGKDFASVPEDKLAKVIYSGVIGDVIVRPYFYSTTTDNGKVEGVGFNLCAVVKKQDGERIGGGAPTDLSNFYDGKNLGIYTDDDEDSEFASGDDDL